MNANGGKRESSSGFEGVYPMLYAFFDGEERLDRAAMRIQVDRLVAAGVHGIAVLGLASETNKLSLEERRTLLEWVAEDVAGRVPLSVTVAEPSVAGQRAFVAAAAGLGAAWAILQPPPVGGMAEAEIVRFFGAVAEDAPIPLGLQIAPGYLGVDISADGLKTLARNHPNVAVLKIEVPPLASAGLVAATEGHFDVFNGRAGQDMTDNLRAGCVGIIPGGETADRLARIFDFMAEGTDQGQAAADRLYGESAGLLVFLDSALDTLLVYGKWVAARRLGLDPERARPRRPYAAPTPFGLAMAERLSAHLDPYPAALDP